MKNHPDILPPVSIPGDGPAREWYSVNIDLPQAVAAEYDRPVKAGELTSRTVEIHGALYRYRASEMSDEEQRQELVRDLQEGMDSGPGTLVTPEFWKSFKQNAERRHAVLLNLQNDGVIGNLLLPKELYEFVVRKIADGVHKNPTEVVIRALSYLQTSFDP